MDFFEHQEAARRASRWLIVTMVVTVLLVLFAVNALFHAVLVGWERPLEPQLVLWVTLGALAVMGLGALVSLAGLAGSGRAVAEALGGREVDPDTRDPDERRLLNVVEEMAIASGVPRPPVFILEEAEINAFAAGYRADDAAIGVTRGLLALPRDELQGVIAHEYSHILNGDMRLNMRLIAVVAGLVAIAGVGEFLFRVALRASAASRGNRRGNPGLLLVVLGLGLWLVGLVGWFCGRLIQAAFSRRREYLADASAVQFTRNPDGIAGALERILSRGSRVHAERASDVAHLFFAQALNSWFATHPPLPERIARIRGLPRERVERAASSAAASAPATTGGEGRIAGFAAGEVLRRAGTFAADGATAVASLLPAALTEAAHEPYRARAVALLPLLAREAAARERQLARLSGSDRLLAAELERLWPAWQGVDADRARWPLLQLVLPVLGGLSPTQRRALWAAAEALALEDGVLTLPEFIVLRRLRRALQATAAPARPLPARTAALACVLAHLAAAAGSSAAAQAYRAGWERLGRPAPPAPPVPDPTALDAALDRLAALAPAERRAAVDAFAHAVAADGVVQPREAELLRLAAAELAVPLPPLSRQAMD